MDRRYASNAGAVYSLGYHLVWCPKYRKPVLVGQVEVHLKELLAERCSERGWEIVALETMPDHVHLFVHADPTDAPAYIANQLKGYTSRVLRREFPHLRSALPTLWSRSYFVSSVGAVSESMIRRYIEDQRTRPPKYGSARLSQPDGTIAP